MKMPAISANAALADRHAAAMRRAGKGVLRSKPHPAHAGEQETTSRLLLNYEEEFNVPTESRSSEALH